MVFAIRMSGNKSGVKANIAASLYIPTVGSEGKLNQIPTTGR